MQETLKKYLKIYKKQQKQLKQQKQQNQQKKQGKQGKQGKQEIPQVKGNSKPQEIKKIMLEKAQSIKSQLSAKNPQVNVQFYLNQRQSQPSGDNIDNIHKTWKKDYQKLQKHHGFIQWLFPNKFQSRFNRKASPITSQQIQIFKTNPKIYERYIKSYDMMLQFYGMKLKVRETGQITTTRNPPFKQRFHATLITSFHNHMRITRMLSSLTLLGFGRYAKNLALFLKNQINNGDLRQLKQCKVYQRQNWGEYETFVQTEQNISDYFKKQKENQ